MMMVTEVALMRAGIGAFTFGGTILYGLSEVKFARFSLAHLFT